MSILTQKVDDIFAPWDKTISPGGSLAVVHEGEIVYQRGYGMAHLEYGVPNTPSTIFHIASISKHFAAMAVVLLAKEGKLSLDDAVSKHVPEVAGIREKITVKQMMHHTSGLRDQWNLAVYAGWRMDDVITTGDIMELVSLQRELNFPPGSEWSYSNTGYTLLGIIVKNLTGKTLREFCEERLFKPLGMKSTHFHDDHNHIVPGRAYSYEPAGEGKFQNAVLSYANAGATSLFTTVQDLALWDEEFYTGRVVGMDVIEQMHEEGILTSGKPTRYALGLMLNEHRGLRVVEHSGGDAGFRSHLVRFPEKRLSVILLCNLGSMAASTLAYRVADLYLEDLEPKRFKPAREKAEKVMQLSTEELTALAGVYYNAQKKTSVLITLKDGMLTAMGMPLEAVSPMKLRVKPMPAITIEFEKGEDGQLKASVRFGGRMAEDYLKCEQAQPKDLKEYEGKYYCPELDVFWKIEVKDDRLAVTRRKYGTKALQPTIEDGFAGDDMMGDLLFERKDGKVNAFRLSDGRVRSLKFIKKG